MHGIDGAVGGGGRDLGEEAGAGGAEAHLLALHVRSHDAQMGQGRIAVRLDAIDHGDANEEQDPHDHQQGPPLALRSHHAAEGVGQGRADHKDQRHLEDIGEGARVFEGVGGIGVEKTAAVAAQELDRFLRRHGPERDRLLGAFEGDGVRRVRQGLGNPHRGQNNRADQRQRQEHVEEGAGLIDPEIADLLTAVTGETPNQSDRHRDPGRARQEGQHGDAHHLRQIT